MSRGQRTGIFGSNLPFGGEAGKVRNRRVSPVAPRPREGPLTEPTAGAQPWPRERVLTPRSGLYAPLLVFSRMRVALSSFHTCTSAFGRRITTESKPRRASAEPVVRMIG